MDIGKKKGPRNEINVTPLIDVVLVLLIIFMVLTPSMLKHLTAAVPRTEDDATAPFSAEVPIIVEYAANRQLALNGEPVSFQALGDKLAERLRIDRRKVVFFKADDDADYGEVIRLMDVARGSGAETLALVTK